MQASLCFMAGLIPFPIPNRTGRFVFPLPKLLFCLLAVALLLFSTASLWSQTDNQTASKQDITVLPKVQPSGIDLMLYESYSNQYQADAIQKVKQLSWWLLERKEGKDVSLPGPVDAPVKVLPVQLQVQSGFNECTGDTTTDFKIPFKTGERLLLISGMALKSGPVASAPIRDVQVLPGKPRTFSFKGHSYQLRATGQQIEENGETSIQDYKLYLSMDKGTEQLLIYITKFDDSFVDLVWVGDLDGDNKADFIFSAPTNYEEAKRFLFLSSKAKSDDLIECVAEVSQSSDC